MNEEQKVQSEQWILGLLAIIVIIAGFNTYQIGKLSDLSSVGTPLQLQATGSSVQSVQQDTSTTKTLEALGVYPRGIPEIYGAELGISFDDVSITDPTKADKTISILGALDDKITLTGDDLKRYIKVLYEDENGISCEYCCGARAVIFDSGEPACGCAHSYAMRGLTKYLITKHGAEFTDEQLLAEAGKWKLLFFPSLIENKAKILQDAGLSDPTIIDLTSNKYRGIEQKASTKPAGSTGGGGMVGGC